MRPPAPCTRISRPDGRGPAGNPVTAPPLVGQTGRMGPVIETTDVVKSFGSTLAVDGLTLAVKR